MLKQSGTGYFLVGIIIGLSVMWVIYKGWF